MVSVHSVFAQIFSVALSCFDIRHDEYEKARCVVVVELGNRTLWKLESDDCVLRVTIYIILYIDEIRALPFIRPRACAITTPLAVNR